MSAGSLIGPGRRLPLSEMYMPEPNSGCWLWLGSLTNKGYGQRNCARGSRGTVTTVAHRLVWESLRGPIPESLQLDHLCRTRCCVNPDHLEPVTQRENVLRGVGSPAMNARKTHCHRGHEFTPGNTWIYRGQRKCGACRVALRTARSSTGFARRGKR